MTVRLLGRFASRILSTSLLMLVAVTAANAYTIVMRDGRRIEVPSSFVVTPATLTYEVQQGIQITLQMSTIDISATEKANAELPGALLRRSNANVAGNPSTARLSSARRTITNRDLEATARRRIASEEAYEKRVKELGLPSLAESRRQAEANAATAQAELRERLAAERQTEEYWRTRANALRTETAALDAEILFVRRKLDEVPYPNWSGSFTSFSSVVPFISFGSVGRGRHFGGPRQHGPGVYSARVGAGPQLSGRVGFGGRQTRSQVFINPGRAGHFGGGPRLGGWPGSNVGLGIGAGVFPTVIGASTAYDFSYERSALITRFNELGAARAGLSARWRELEEEARRAGAAPGWLRR